MEKSTAYLTLWSRCNVSPCVFCTMGETSKNKQEPLAYGIWKILNEITVKLNSMDWDKYDKVSFTGGEALNHPEHRRPLGPILKLPELLRPYVLAGRLKKIVFNTSLKFGYRGSSLEALVTELESQYPEVAAIVEFNTSWDKKYRFFGNDSANWMHCIRSLRDKGFRVHVTTICTQAFIKAYEASALSVDSLMRDFPGDTFDLVPASGKHAKLDPMPDFFPKRDHFRYFLEVFSDRDAPAFMRFVDQMRGAAPIQYGPIGQAIRPRMALCGHLQGLKNYANSEKCAMCDVEEFLKTFKDGNK